MQKIKGVIKERKFKFISFFWLLMSIQFVVGNNLQERGYLSNTIQEIIIDILKIIILFIAFIVIHYVVLHLIEERKTKNKTNANVKTKPEMKSWKKTIIYFLIIVVCWLPAIIAFAPVMTNYDGPWQIFRYVLDILDTRQPIIHSVLMGIFFVFGHLQFNSVSVGMLLFTIFQVCIMAGIFAYSVKIVEQTTNKKWIRNISLIFYALFPFNQLFPLMTTKDTLFAGLALLFIINLSKLVKGEYKFLDYLYMIVLTVLMLLFRNNAVYALFVSMPFLIVIWHNNKKVLKNILLSFIVIIIIYQISMNLLIYIYNPRINTDQEKLSIFSQATARICKEKGEELTEEEKQNINFYFHDYKKIGEVYQPNISDKTKDMTNCENIYGNKIEFGKFMLHLFIRYPQIYVESFLNTIRGYWYIADSSFDDLYDSEDKGCLELTIGSFTIEDWNLAPSIRDFYLKMFAENNYEKIPIINIVFKPAIYFYLLIAYCLYALYKKDKNKETIGIYLLLYFLTCFLGPVALIRYIYAVIVSVPIIALSVFKDTKKEKI